MSRTKAEHDRERRKRKFVPKGERRARRFYQDEAMMSAGCVVSRPHGRHWPQLGE
jgi:hypothetical protein